MNINNNLMLKNILIKFKFKS